jgi:hypothetical protein
VLAECRLREGTRKGESRDESNGTGASEFQHHRSFIERFDGQRYAGGRN